MGLSPRMRGNHEPRPPRAVGGGSIPAYAGEPRRVVSSLVSLLVYPRVCGGTMAVKGFSERVQGLSPRMRGNPTAISILGDDGGSIPAYAGEPLYGIRQPPQSAVYPRVCGGTRPAARLRKSRRGLSPRMRGNQASGPFAEITQRSIPAYAGEPCWLPSWPRTTLVYPRVCGGTARLTPTARAIVGLSPRMRGNLDAV